MNITVSSEDLQSRKKAEKRIKELIRLKKECNKKQEDLNIDFNLDDIIDTSLKADISICIKALQIESKKQRYEYIYGSVCDYLDKEFVENNFCNFKNDICRENRSSCCYYFSKFRIFGKPIHCRYLINKSCTVKCMACKLFACEKIKKEFGVSYTPNTFLPIKLFFNPVQKLLLQYTLFTPEDKIIKRLMKVE